MSAPQPFKLLYVCADNRTRSPLAAGLTLQHVVTKRAGAGWLIKSAGIEADEGGAGRAEAVQAAATLHLDLSGHVTHKLSDDDIAWADLVIAMDWEHAAHIWSVVPQSWNKAFTIREFVHWGKQTPARPAILFPDRHHQMQDRIDQAHERRRRARADHGFWGGLRPGDLNVVEPEGRGETSWRNFARSIRALSVDVVNLLGGA